MASLEDANDPAVKARAPRMARMVRFVHALQVHMAQHEFIQGAGVTQMASEYVPQDSADVITLAALQDLFLGAGVEPPEPGSS